MSFLDVKKAVEIIKALKHDVRPNPMYIYYEKKYNIELYMSPIFKVIKNRDIDVNKFINTISVETFKDMFEIVFDYFLNTDIEKIEKTDIKLYFDKYGINGKLLNEYLSKYNEKYSGYISQFSEYNNLYMYLTVSKEDLIEGPNRYSKGKIGKDISDSIIMLYVMKISKKKESFSLTNTSSYLPIIIIVLIMIITVMTFYVIKKIKIDIYIYNFYIVDKMLLLFIIIVITFEKVITIDSNNVTYINIPSQNM